MHGVQTGYSIQKNTFLGFISAVKHASNITTWQSNGNEIIKI